MADPVRDACETCFDAHANDCSGFARAVASRLAVTLTGLANDIGETIRNDPAWSPVSDGVEAAQAVAAGKLVIAGLRGGEQAHPDEHGHVVVVVATPAGQQLAHGKYPFAYWGRLGGGMRDQTVNWA